MLNINAVIRVVAVKRKADLNSVQVIIVECQVAKIPKQEVLPIAWFTNVAKVTALMREAVDYIVVLILARRMVVQVKLMGIAVITNAENVILKDWMASTFVEIINAVQAVVLPKHIVVVAKDIALHITENICSVIFLDND